MLMLGIQFILFYICDAQADDNVLVTLLYQLYHILTRVIPLVMLHMLADASQNPSTT